MTIIADKGRQESYSKCLGVMGAYFRRSWAGRPIKRVSSKGFAKSESEAF